MFVILGFITLPVKSSTELTSAWRPQELGDNGRLLFNIQLYRYISCTRATIHDKSEVAGAV
jgi:hypothetical protein